MSLSTDLGLRRCLRGLAALLLVLGLSTCTDNLGPDAERTTFYTTPTGLATTNPPQVFVGAGDISSCSSNNDEATAELLDNIAGTVFLVGDNVYPNGTSSEFANCYQPTWGRHKARTKPVPGNHDYNTSGGSGYFGYFGSAAGTPGQGYYSYDLGQWHIIALNSEITKTASSPQMQWLRADLAAHPNQCTAALWHEPLYSSDGGSGSGGVTFSSVRPFWDTLYAYGADLILNGHRHNYERIAPMKPDGKSDPTYGIRTMVVGMGGIGGSSLTNVFPLSEARNGNTFGVLKLYLYDDSYAWKFVPVAGKTYSDSGSTACHPRPGSDPPVATALAFAVQPSHTVAGAAITPAVQAEIRDQFGARLTTASNSITLAIGTNPSGGTLSGTTTVAAVNGVATFSGLSIDQVGSGYTLTATSSGLTGATSAAFNITAPPVPTAVGFAVQPSNTGVGSAISPAVTVEIRDQSGARIATATNNVTLAIGTNPAGGTLSGTTTVAAVNGVATFSDLSIDRAGTGYTLAATSSGLSGATSSAFTITAAPIATALGFAVQPSHTVAGAAITPAVQAEIRDQFGARLTTASNSITLAIGTNPSGGTLSGTTTVAAVNGVATFSGLSIDQVGSGYTLAATSAGLIGATSAAFDVTATPPQGITHTLLTSGVVLTNQNTTTTASISPAPNTLVTITLLSHRSTATISPIVTGGGMASWDIVSSVDFDTLALPHRRLTIYRAMSAAPGSGPITFKFTNQVSNLEWIVSQWDGVETSGVNGAGAVVQTGSNRANSVNGLSIALAPFGSTANVALGAFGVNSQVSIITPAPGFTEIDEQPANEGTRGDLQTQWAVNQPTIGASWPSLKGGALGVELKARSGP
ncbi:MAG TPA: metallophosphoesterase [Gemmatimonadales bacterium]|nr:metallophosphoesterase [Gemmatimonadales bacterium]